MEEAQHIELGKRGEELAHKHLAQKGYEIIEKNWRCGHLEVDLIVKGKSFLIFVEVKTRFTEFFGNPEMAVNYKKQRLLTKAATAYIRSKNYNGEVRFDVISIILNHQKQELEHIKDAFYPRN